MPALEDNGITIVAPASRPSAGWPPQPPLHASRSSMSANGGSAAAHARAHAMFSSGSNGHGSMTPPSTVGTSAVRDSLTSRRSGEMPGSGGDCGFGSSSGATNCRDGTSPIRDRLVHSHAVLDADLSQQEVELSSGPRNSRRGGLQVRLVPDRQGRGTQGGAPTH